MKYNDKIMFIDHNKYDGKIMFNSVLIFCCQISLK